MVYIPLDYCYQGSVIGIYNIYVISYNYLNLTNSHI